MLYRIIGVFCVFCCLLIGVNAFNLIGFIYDGESITSVSYASPSDDFNKSQSSKNINPIEKKQVKNICDQGGCNNDHPFQKEIRKFNSETKISYDLDKKQNELNKKEEILNNKENILNMTQKEIQIQMNDLEKIKNNFAKQEDNADKILENDSDKLVKIYEAMRPGDAALIFNVLDLRIGVRLLSQMSPRKSSAIMALMSPERVVLITQLLSKIHSHI
ncbi:MotE family protein [Swingsia samuiensis]|uniref:Magnesium transporter MgtE intracellular domain-containing protein n=1 Tax=Swingsia samuiensis TaxID=1293412 RepID=A0A4Y6UJ98_9PROT|nr:hypothetical protein [Swingsia samuiensis]QDH17134.1 hypothetical protein E3D00_05820 [Swingsia samuiensis]